VSCARSSIWSKAPATSAPDDLITSENPRQGVGILGGTFNPPHVGHLALARAAARDLGLERVLLCPALLAPHKSHAQDDPGAEHRLRMCHLAIGDNPLLGVCELELERPGPSYTVDTLRSIHANNPGLEVTLIVGADIARTLGTWREPAEILRLARLAVAERDGAGRDEVLAVLAALGGGENETVFIDMAPVRVSSSMVRLRAGAGESIEEIVGPQVASYIVQHDLYRSGVAPRPATGTSTMTLGGNSR
jgi:nicotinate-nucleotide adenylyltransferase